MPASQFRTTLGALLAPLAFAFAAGAAGCAASTPKEKMDDLKTAVDGYNHAFRWKNYARAAMFLPPDLRGSFIATYEDDEASLQIEDYRVDRVDFDSDRATVTVRLRYLLLPSVTLERVTLTQHWHKIGRTWILETEEGSLRELDKTLAPKLPAEPEVRPEQEGNTELEVFGPED